MKGILIGIFYVIHYRIGRLFVLIIFINFCARTSTEIAITCNGIVCCAMVAVIALVSGIVFSIVACKYRLREREMKWLTCTSLQRSTMELEKMIQIDTLISDRDA